MYTSRFLLISFILLHTIGWSQDTDKDIKYLVQKGWKHFDGGRNALTLTGNYDVNYYRLDLTVENPGVRYLSGSVTTYFKPKCADFDTIYFHLRNNMTVDSVTYHQAHVPSFSFTSNTV